MNNEDYMKMLYVFNHAFDKNQKILIYWSNGLKVKCKSFSGVYETDTEPEDEDYIGEYAAAVNEVEVIEQGKDDLVRILYNAMEISLVNIPNQISLEDGTILWSLEGDISRSNIKNEDI